MWSREVVARVKVMAGGGGGDDDGCASLVVFSCLFFVRCLP